MGYLQAEAKGNPFLVENPNFPQGSGNREVGLGDALPDWYDPPALDPSLQEHLYGQISALSLSSRRREALVYLTQWLSNSGYLEQTPQTWAAGSPWSPRELEAVVPLLQSLDPPGVGARCLKECLLLQLQAQPQGLPALLVREYLEELADCAGSSFEAKRSSEALLQKLRSRGQIPPNANLDTLQAAIRQIQALEPRPARNFGSSSAPIVTPDLQAEPQAMGSWQVSLVYEVNQRFCLNQEALSLLTSNNRPQDVRQLDLLQKARSLLTALNQWQENLLKVGQFLVDRQHVFLSSRDGLDLVPTPQQLVAQAVGLSDATVSRIVRERYLLLSNQPSRIVPLRTLCVPVGVGGRTTQQVQQLLIQLIQSEPPTAPYSDEQLAQLLKIRFGLAIARRTIAKYRNLAGIEPAGIRRRHCL
jgi:RNA polymerase sigma-54 factor